MTTKLDPEAAEAQLNRLLVVASALRAHAKMPLTQKLGGAAPLAFTGLGVDPTSTPQSQYSSLRFRCSINDPTAGTDTGAPDPELVARYVHKAIREHRDSILESAARHAKEEAGRQAESLRGRAREVIRIADEALKGGRKKK